MLNALRLTDGVAAASFAERTGYSLAIVQRELSEAVRRGLLDPDPATIRPTALGRRFLNDLQALFLKDHPRPAQVQPQPQPQPLTRHARMTAGDHDD